MDIQEQFNWLLRNGKVTNAMTIEKPPFIHPVQLTITCPNCTAGLLVTQADFKFDRVGRYVVCAACQNFIPVNLPPNPIR